MPELPEVETIVRDLAGVLPGAKFDSVQVLRPDLIAPADPADFAARIEGRRVEAVSRRAKNIVIELDCGRLVVNLGMTGRLLLVPAADEAPPYTGVRFFLAGSSTLLYHDVRRFGRLWYAAEEQWREWESGLGFEPLSDEFTADALLGLARRSRVAVKTWLMDQRRVVGVGNIYASEALFRAGIDPALPARELTETSAAALQRAIREVLGEAIEFRGTTLLDYRDAAGEAGLFRDRLQVYDRAGEPCRACGSEIRRMVQGGRSTFFCTSCQAR